MRLKIDHTTTYRFPHPVAHGVQRLRLTPKATQGQRIVEWTMSFTGVTEQLSYDDQNFNHTTLVSVQPGTREVVLACSGVVETEDFSGVIGHHSGHLPLWSFLGATPLTKPGARVRQLLGQIDKGTDTLGALHTLSDLVHDALAWMPGATGPETTAEEALAKGQGVCQDMAHAFIAAARLLDVPARYVSGYLLLHGRTQQDAMHAWAEAFVEGLGWVGFDVANRISPDQHYVRVATGRDYRDAAPVLGVRYGQPVEELAVALAVEQQAAEQ